MKSIFKYQLKLLTNEVDMHEGAEVLSVQMQGDTPCLWASVDTSKPKETREFVVIGTGHPYDPAGLKYVGTYQQVPFVWHVFEVLK